MSTRPPANFIADSPGLDFLNSIATPVDVPVDWLDSGDGLVAWLAQANLVPTHALNALAEQATPGELDKVAGQARVLREWFRGFVRKHMGRPLAPAAVDELGPLNALLKRDETFSRVAERRDSDGLRLELQTMRLWRSPESLLLPIGEALARCVCDEDFANIRACEGHVCTLIFVDRTRRQGKGGAAWRYAAIAPNKPRIAIGSGPRADTTAFQLFALIRDEAACSRTGS